MKIHRNKFVIRYLCKYLNHDSYWKEPGCIGIRVDNYNAAIARFRDIHEESAIIVSCEPYVEYEDGDPISVTIQGKIVDAKYSEDIIGGGVQVIDSNGKYHEVSYHDIIKDFKNNPNQTQDKWPTSTT
ncbi:hypothetical protein E6Q11_05165 [Candidatus Dojkabacteria bacterium]|uniref:Uncharacterized protein n=1 Tax=Candidatus Dojkabacteria bacterium TaxID=2099670 RepID=A0A5C7J5K8_9BACT|nr:MAG: hypothetical protein E6Q11_05165 [Candidatus Dojkabacteria bacterium]